MLSKMRFAPTVLAAALLLCGPNAAEAGFEDAAPGDVLAFVGIDDLTSLKATFDQTAWGRLLADPALGSFKEHMAKQLAELGAEAEAETGTDPFKLLEMVSGGAALMLLELAGPDEVDPEAEMIPFALGMMMGVGDRGEEFLTGLDALFDKTVESGEAIRQFESEGDVEVTVIREGSEETKEKFELRYGVTDGTFVAVFQAEEMVQKGHFGALLDGLAGEAEEPLKDTDSFVDSVAGEVSDGVRAFIDVKRLLGRAVAAAEKSGDLSEEDLRTMEVLGLADLQVMTMGLQFGEDESRLDAGLTWSGQGHLVQIARSLFPGGEIRLPALMPGEPYSATMLRIDVLAGMDAIMAAMKEISPDEAEGAQAMMEMSFQQEGFNVRDDLLGNLEGEMAFFTAPIEDDLEALTGTEDDPQSIGILVGLKDGTAVETALEALIRSQGMHAARKRREFQGQSIYSLPSPLGGSIHYSVLTDLLAISMSSEIMDDVLRRRGDSDLPTLATNPEFSTALKDLLQGDLTSAGYTDSATQVRALLGAIRSIVKDGQVPGMPMRIHPGLSDEELEFELPDPDLADKYFEGAAVNVMSISERGVRLTTIGP